MKIKITGKELKITEAINDYVERKLDRIDKYFEDAEAEVTLRTEKNEQIAEIYVFANGEKYYEIKPITPEDAMLKLQEKPTHNFLAFINVETGKVNVIHKLKDGKNYGLVEPEA